jgi:hypothetical protein
MIVLEDVMKYELTEEKKTIDKTTFYRIRALKDFSNVKVGDLGGWIESERNLSQNGDAWVYDNAQVHGNAWVCDDARVSGDAQVYGDALVFGDAWVSGNSLVFGDAWVCDNSQVSGNARVCGNAQVYDNAQVFGDAWVSGDAQVYDDARIEHTADYLFIGPIGSCEPFTTFYRTENGISVSCGCFTGKLDEFAAKVDETHGDNKHGKAYKAAIEFVKQVMG